jgi:hypothetical protein
MKRLVLIAIVLVFWFWALPILWSAIQPKTPANAYFIPHPAPYQFELERANRIWPG